MTVKKLLCTLLLAAATLSLRAQRYGDFAITLWDNASAPHSNELTGPETGVDHERYGNTTTAELYLFVPDPVKATGQGVVVCPGGGYGYTSFSNEGEPVGRWLAEQGIVAAVLKYRMPNGHPEVPLEDVELAIRILRGEIAGIKNPAAEEAVKRGYTARQVGVMGFSAGGHLAAMVSTMGATRPDFSILVYPVITGETGWCHAGSFDNLLGKARTAQLTARYSLENRVDGKTPPAILFHCDDDRAVPSVSSTRYYESLKRNGIEAVLHIFPAGGHGWGMRADYAYRPQWQSALTDWLQRIRKE